MSRDPVAGLAGRLAEVFADTAVRARGMAAGPEAAVRARATEAQMEKWERELAARIRPWLAGVAADPDVPADIRDLFGVLCNPGHQTDFILTIVSLPFYVMALAAAVGTANVENMRQYSWKADPLRVLSGQEAGGLLARGRIGESDARAQARADGYDPERLGWLKDLNVRPLPLGELLSAWRRGIISDQDLAYGLADNGLDGRWDAAARRLAYTPPGAAEAIQAAVQGHLSVDESKRQLADSGVDPQNWQWLYDTAGNPPGTVEMLGLYRRGLIDEATMVAAIRESRVKDKYIPAILQLARHLMPERTVVSAVHQGVFTHDQALRHLMDLGFNAADAAALVNEASAHKLAGTRQLAQSQVVAAYESRALTRVEASDHLVGLGYDPQEAGFVLDLADHARTRKFRDTAIAAVHARYVRWKTDRPHASVALDKLGVVAAERDGLLALWDLERGVDVPDLTVAQLQGLYARGNIDEQTFLTRIGAHGYTAGDAQLLLELTAPKPKARPTPAAGAGPAGP